MKKTKQLFLLITKPIFAVSCSLCLLICLSLAGTSWGESTLKDDFFEYLIENRYDPFLPFVQEERTINTTTPDEVVDIDDELFGMRLFEPDQLKVVAILTTKTKKIAMLQDLIGQGYAVTTGTLIGKRGVVKDISSKGVVIEETAMTRSGKKRLTQIVMVLKPEGE